MFGRFLNILAATGLVVIGAIGVAIFKAGPLHVDPCEDDHIAWSLAREAVTKRLKAPSTATFPSRYGGDVEIRSAPDCRLFVLSWVDAQNGYGAMVRTPFVVKIRASRTSARPSVEDVALGN